MVAALAFSSTGVGVAAFEIERGGVGVIVPPPNSAVGRTVPSAISVRLGEGVSVGKSVGVGCKRIRLASTQPSLPSSMRMLSHVPSLLRPRISTRVAGRSTEIAEKLTPGPSRTLIDCSELTLPVIGGVDVGVGLSEGVGGMVVSEGVKVIVGSGVRDGIGVAVKRGVRLTLGASVSVGTVSAFVSVEQLLSSSSPRRIA